MPTLKTDGLKFCVLLLGLRNDYQFIVQIAVSLPVCGGGLLCSSVKMRADIHSEDSRARVGEYYGRGGGCLFEKNEKNLKMSLQKFCWGVYYVPVAPDGGNDGLI